MSFSDFHMKSPSLYVHFPFCETKCHYCDFYSLAKDRVRPEDPDRFESALRIEAQNSHSLLADELETVFFGGGTPSMTPPDSMSRAMDPILSHCRLSPQTEWTMEANPSSIVQSDMKAYRKLGVNRISMGVQALRDDLLQRLGRAHSQAVALQALNSVFEAGFTNVSVDLLCGVPGQSLKDLESFLETLTRFPITHLSCYLLTLPPHHRMYRELPGEAAQLEHLLLIDRWLRSAGFEHYEISNFAKPGHRARHNLNYWLGRSYLGLGPSAHSFDSSAGCRWKNFSSLHRYVELLEKGKSPREWSEALTPDQRELERWMLALRLDTGFPKVWLDTDFRRQRAKEFEERGLLEAHPDDPSRLRLTAHGFALSDQLIAALA